MTDIIIESIMMDGDYESISFSNKDNIYELLWYYDIIKADADSGDESAIVVLLDFDRLINSKKKNRNFKRIYDCISIQLGESVIGKANPSKSLLEVLSLVNKESLDISEKELEKDVNEVIRLNNNYWKNSIKKKHKIRRSKKRLFDSDIPVKGYLEMDSNIKYSRLESRNEFTKSTPKEILRLEKVHELNSKKLEELTKKSNKCKLERDEMNTRIRYRISLNEDIKLLKDRYGIIYQTNQFGVSKSNVTFLSYLNNDGSNCKSEVKDRNLDLVSEWQVNKINHMSQNILTARQLMWFQMYYIEGLTQKEISQLTGRDQANISRALAISIDKIKEFLISA